jgi:hypothetical protein
VKRYYQASPDALSRSHTTSATIRYRFPQSFAIHLHNKNSHPNDWKSSPTLPDSGCRRQVDPESV